MNVNFEAIEKAWGKPKKDTELKYWQKLYISASLERTKLREILNELEEWLKKICEQEFVFEDGDDYCTERAYGCKVCLDKIQELKKENENGHK